MKIFRNLQGLRFVAFVLVFLDHTYKYLGMDKRIFHFGARGVEIFFILAGLLIAYHYSDKDIDSSVKGSLSFAFNKLKKFYILHLLTFVCFFSTPFLKFIKNPFCYNDSIQLLTNSILNITLLQSWYPPAKYSFNGPTWFLSSILFAYFMVPSIVNFFKNRSKEFFCLSFFVVFIFKMFFDTLFYELRIKIPMVHFYTNPAYRFIDFLLGYIFFLILNQREFNKCWVNIIQAILLACLPYSWLFFDKVWAPSSFILIALVFVYFCNVQKGILDCILGNKLFVYLGNISFELFIFHFVALSITRNLNKFLGGSLSDQYFWITAFLLNILLAIIASKKYRYIS